MSEGLELSWQDRVERSLADTYKPEGVRMWLNGRNRALEYRVPQDVIDAGEGRLVWELAERLAGGPVRD